MAYAAIALLTWLLPAGILVRNATPGLTVPVRIYDAVSLGENIRSDAIGTARDIFTRAGIATSWNVCDDARSRWSENRSCDRPLVGELIIRFVPQPNRISADVVGSAVIDRKAGYGLLATAYVDRIAEIARSVKWPTGVLLGRVVAHEMGHLLLGPGSHGATGIMRGVWPVAAFASHSMSDFEFSAEDRVRLIRTAEDVVHGNRCRLTVTVYGVSSGVR